ncbi:MAG: hypothetical protein H6509_00335 [Bryobacterales bacterium]|nr:hypothetical protein [Bryobacterales bacterium]
MPNMPELKSELEQQRDELRVKLHLGSMELKQQWEDLESKWESFSAKARLEETSQDVSEALSLLGDEIKSGYEKIKAALD